MPRRQRVRVSATSQAAARLRGDGHHHAVARVGVTPARRTRTPAATGARVRGRCRRAPRLRRRGGRRCGRRRRGAGSMATSMMRPAGVASSQAPARAVSSHASNTASRRGSDSACYDAGRWSIEHGPPRRGETSLCYTRRVDAQHVGREGAGMQIEWHIRHVVLVKDEPAESRPKRGVLPRLGQVREAVARLICHALVRTSVRACSSDPSAARVRPPSRRARASRRSHGDARRPRDRASRGREQSTASHVARTAVQAFELRLAAASLSCLARLRATGRSRSA